METPLKHQSLPIAGTFTPEAAELFTGTPTFITQQVRADIDKEMQELDRKIMGTTEQLTQQALIDIERKREAQIIEVLNHRGHNITTRTEFIHFLKTRCELGTFQHNNKCILKVDSVPVCEWFNTIEVTQQGTNITIIAGK